MTTKGEGIRSLIDVAPAWKPHAEGHIVKVPSFNLAKAKSDQPYTVEMDGHIAKSCSCADWYYRRQKYGGDILTEGRRCKHGEFVEELARDWWNKCWALKESGWSVSELRTLWVLCRSKHGVEAGARLWVEREFGQRAKSRRAA